MKILTILIHSIAHLLSWNYGICECWWEGDVLMTGFKCTGCGKIYHIQKCPIAATPEFHLRK